MKKLLLVVATAVGASVLKKNLERSRADKDLWAEATSGPAATGPDKDSWAGATDTPKTD